MRSTLSERPPFPMFRWPEHWRSTLDDEIEQGERFRHRVLWAKFQLDRFLGLDFNPAHSHITAKEGWS